jgi:hypothetical protein
MPPATPRGDGAFVVFADEAFAGFALSVVGRECRLRTPPHGFAKNLSIFKFG